MPTSKSKYSKYVPSTAEVRRQTKAAGRRAADVEAGHRDAAKARKRRRRETASQGYKAVLDRQRTPPSPE